MGRPGNSAERSCFATAECADSFVEHVSTLVPRPGIEVSFRLPHGHRCAYGIGTYDERKRGIKWRIKGEGEAACKWLRLAITRSHRSQLHLYLLALLFACFVGERK